MVKIKLLQKNTNSRNEKKQKGYITIVSSVIISMTLMMSLLDQSKAGFYARLAILDHERKTISERFAFSCTEIARLKISENVNYEGNETITMHDGNSLSQSECFIKDIIHFSETITLYTSTTFQNAETDLQVEIDPTNFRVLKFLLQ